MLEHCECKKKKTKEKEKSKRTIETKLCFSFIKWMKKTWRHGVNGILTLSPFCHILVNNKTA